jgi:peptide/nickel transport system ATP-binding protein
VGLPPERADAYPFQMSGGQRQRALIAMMLAGNPRFLIADEPTTALDVVVQAQILKLISRIQRERGMGLLLITHDIAVAAEMADDLAVAYAGQIVESGPAAEVLHHPRHPYTQALLGVQEGLEQRGQRLVAIAGSVPLAAPAQAGPGRCRFAPRCEWAQAACREAGPTLQAAHGGPGAAQVRCFFPLGSIASTSPQQPAFDLPVEGQTVTSAERPVVLEARNLLIGYPIRKGLLRRTVGQTVTVNQVSLALAEGETLALVGESGCGKTTVARTLLQLQRQTAGEVLLDGQVVQGDRPADLQRLRQSVQIVFQDPYASLNPRLSVGEILEEGLLSLCPEVGAAERQERVVQLIQQVGLDPQALRRYPHAFSGGQRQRIAIARALAVRPRVLICDEPTSALDISVQAQILNLLKDLQQQHGLSYLLISHNLPVVGYLADRVAVMQKGVIVESGSVQEVLHQPQHAYTQTLLAAVPKMPG